MCKSNSSLIPTPIDVCPTHRHPLPPAPSPYRHPRCLGPAGSFLPAGGIFPGAYFSVQPPYFLEIFHKKYNFLTSNVCHGPLDAWLVPSSIGSVHDLEIEDDEF